MHDNLVVCRQVAFKAVCEGLHYKHCILVHVYANALVYADRTGKVTVLKHDFPIPDVYLYSTSFKCRMIKFKVHAY